MSWTGKKSVAPSRQRFNNAGAATAENPQSMNVSKQAAFLKLSRAVEQELGQQTESIRQLQDKLLKKFEQISAGHENSAIEQIFNKSQAHGQQDSQPMDASLSFDSSLFTFHLPDPLPFTVPDVAAVSKKAASSTDRDRVQTLEEMTKEWSAQKETHSSQLLNHSSINPLSVSDQNISRLLQTASPAASPFELKRSNPSFVSSLLRQSLTNEELKEKSSHSSASESISSLPLSFNYRGENPQSSQRPLKDRTNYHEQPNQRSTEFPALDRAVFKHIEGQTNDMFPALARALQLRQQRLESTPAAAAEPVSQSQNFRNSKIQNLNFHESKQHPANAASSDVNHHQSPHPSASHSTATPAAAPETRPAGVTLSDLDTAVSPKLQHTQSKVHSTSVAFPIQPEDDVGQLLRQQALHLIANQVQTRIRFLTRQRVFLLWRVRYKLTRATNIVVHKRLQSALRKWQSESRAERARKDQAAIKVQTCYRRHRAESNYPKLRMAARFRSISLLRLVFNHWHNRVARILRFKRHWQEKVAWGGSQTPCRSRVSFPARRWRSTEGTMVMAEQYSRWRMLCVCYAKWIRWIAEQKRFDQPSTQPKAVSWKRT